MSAAPTGSRRCARPWAAGTPRAGCSARGDSCGEDHRIRDERCRFVLRPVPHEIAVAVPDRERVTALLGVRDAAELTPDMHVAVEHDLTAIDPDEALLLLRVLARLDDERPGHADECRLTPHEGVRVFDGRDDR